MYLKNQFLLPDGCKDLLPGDARRKHDITNILTSYFEKFGYNLVSPPLIEFEESLFSNASTDLEKQTFRILDPLSSQVIGIRPDITIQTARIATSRLKNDPKPIRLSYSGEILRVKGTGLYADRQMTQTGIELIGSSSLQADIEVLTTTLNALSRANIKDISLDFSIPKLTRILLANYSFSDEQKKNLLYALDHKDINNIKYYGGEIKDLLIQLCNVSQADTTSIDILKQLKLPSKAQKLVSDMIAIITALKDLAPDLPITVDLVEYRGFQYHDGICFSILSTTDMLEIGCGGRYHFSYNDQAIDAIGCSLYVNHILRVAPIIPNKHLKKVYVPYSTPHKDILSLYEDDDIIIINALDETDNIENAARVMQCTHLFKDGAIQAL